MDQGDHTSPGNGGKGMLSPFLARLAGLSSALDWSGRIIGAVCLAIMFVALLANVILRYAFGSGITWAYEIHALLLPWLVAGGIVIAAAQSRNIAITLLPDLVPPQVRRAIMIAVQVAILLISICVLQSSVPILKASRFQTLSTLGITQVWGYSSLVYAFAGMAIVAVVDLLRLLSGQDVGDHDPGHSSLS